MYTTGRAPVQATYTKAVDFLRTILKLQMPRC